MSKIKRISAELAIDNILNLFMKTVGMKKVI